MGLASTIDIGVCTSLNQNKQLARIYCLANDGLNFCCQQVNASTLSGDSGERVCCSLSDYLGQQWVTLQSIEIYSILLAAFFVATLMIVIWFFLTTHKIGESNVNKSRKVIIRHLMRKQLLHKSKMHDDSVLASVRRIKDTFSESLKRRKRGKQLRFEKQPAVINASSGAGNHPTPNKQLATSQKQHHKQHHNRASSPKPKSPAISKIASKSLLSGTNIKSPAKMAKSGVIPITSKYNAKSPGQAPSLTIHSRTPTSGSKMVSSPGSPLGSAPSASRPVAKSPIV